MPPTQTRWWSTCGARLDCRAPWLLPCFVHLRLRPRAHAATHVSQEYVQGVRAQAGAATPKGACSATALPSEHCTAPFSLRSASASFAQSVERVLATMQRKSGTAAPERGGNHTDERLEALERRHLERRQDGDLSLDSDEGGDEDEDDEESSGPEDDRCAHVY